MTEIATLARPYALAVFRRAKETGTVKDWADALDILATAMSEDAVRSAIANPRVERSRVVHILAELCAGPVGTECANLLDTLADNARLSLLGSIKALFDACRTEDEGYVEASVTTAYPLTEGEEKALSKTLTGVLGRKVRLATREDRTLIGGLVVRAGDRVIDASVRRQLERLTHRI